MEFIMRKFVSALSVFVLVSGVGLWTIEAPGGQANGADDFLRQRLEAAQEGAKLAQGMYERGMADFQMVSLWKRRVTSSELAMARTRDQRLAALQKEVERAKDAEEMVRRRVSAGLVPALDAISARYERLDAEAALAAEQQQP
jgi:outer membrane protein TolC